MTAPGGGGGGGSPDEPGGFLRGPGLEAFAGPPGPPPEPPPAPAHGHGLVLGKFYPPHAGHLHLVEAAARASGRVTVLVLAASWEAIPLATREGWMRELCAGWPHVTVFGAMDEVPVDYEDAGVWDAHMAVFEAAVAGAVAGAGLPPFASRVDAVFTSEAYGDELARRFGALHVSVDPGRWARPVSGTSLRERPESAWEWVSAPVRAFLARRVVVLGAESTGTTTLARDLAEALRARGGAWAATRWVPEYGRAYSEEKLRLLRLSRPDAPPEALAWATADFVAVARRQQADEDAAAREGSPVLVCDTDALATAVWHERYMGTSSPAVEAIAARAHHDLYLLTDHAGVPFEQDGLRDGEHLRPWMTARFREVLAAGTTPWIEVSGTRRERLAQALAAVDALLTRPPSLSRPATT